MVLLTLILTPSLMLSDYYLTLVGEVLRRKSQPHVLLKLESYELNPFLQKDVAQLKWFNWRYLSAVLGITSLMVFLAYGYEAQVSPVPFVGFLGLLSVYFGVVIGRHLQSILSFSNSLRTPQPASDQCELNQKTVITVEEAIQVNQLSNISFLPPFGLCALITRHEFMIGGFCGILMLMLAHFMWLKQVQLMRRKASTK